MNSEPLRTQGVAPPVMSVYCANALATLFGLINALDFPCTTNRRFGAV
jgi:hypothetical protein